MTPTEIASLAIAGAWGYIGRKFLAAAGQLGLPVSVLDVSPAPADLDLTRVTQYRDQDAFYRQPAALFHLALHPEQRARAMNLLLARAPHEPILVLCEKPMVPPESPAECGEIVEAIDRSGAIVLYDFPELFDPITHRILEYLAPCRDVAIESIAVVRSKDREDPRNQRNTKRMVHIQYQESVHCLAFVLFLLAQIRGGAEAVFRDGLTVRAEATPYQPPNPAAYPYVVDGRCEYSLQLGSVRIAGLTDFKRGAAWAKRRLIAGRADGRPFQIEVDFLEGKKRLTIDGRAQDDVVDTDSYAEVIKRFGQWVTEVPKQQLREGLFPNAAFARITYQLSSLLWAASWRQTAITLESLADLLQFDAGFAAAYPRFDRYPQP